MNKGFCQLVRRDDARSAKYPSPAERDGRRYPSASALGERSKKDQSLGDGTAFENMLLVHVLR